MNTPFIKKALAMVGALLMTWSASAATIFAPERLPGEWTGTIDDIQTIYAAAYALDPDQPTPAEVGVFLYRYTVSSGNAEYQSGMFTTAISSGLRSDYGGSITQGGQLATLTYTGPDGYLGIKYVAVEATSSSGYQFSLWKWPGNTPINNGDTILVDNRGLFTGETPNTLSPITRVAVIPDASMTLSLMVLAIVGMAAFGRKIR